MNGTSKGGIWCGIVLAAGEGLRLRSFIHEILGATLPKQYVRLVGPHSLLEKTFIRAEKLIEGERLFTVVSAAHLEYPEARGQLSSRPKHTVIVQPQSRDTGAGVLLPLMHVYKRYPEASVAVFPSDHFIIEEDLFMARVAFAFRVVERHPASLVLLGIKPNDPEPQYGYILPGQRKAGFRGVCKITRFVEKPNRNFARELALQGGLWNTMVMVFKAKTMLEMVREMAPDVHRAFERILTAIGSPNESAVVGAAYQDMEFLNFSRGLLEALPLRHRSSLLVVPVSGVYWSDWGLPRNVQSTLIRTGTSLPFAFTPKTAGDRLLGTPLK